MTPDNAPPSGPSTTRVLVVEDHEAKRRLLEAAFREAGFEVRTAPTAEAALELARELPPDVAVSGALLLAEVDGLAFCHRLKRDPALRQVAAVLYGAAFDDDGEEELAAASGADLCLPASVEPEELAARIRRLLDEQRSERRAPRRPALVDDTDLRPYREALTRRLAFRLEDLEQANRRLERRVRQRTLELEALAYSVAHDLRTPLRAIHGYSSLLQAELGAGLPESAHRYVGLIQKGVERMGQLVDDVLLLVRLGRWTVRRQRVPMRPLVESTLQDLEPSLQNRRVEISIADDLPDAWADPSLLRRAVSDLLENALKFTRPRTTARIEIGSRPAEGCAPVFYVRDNGVGFDMAHSSKLFQVFHRLHHDEEFEGIGAGLAVVSRIVDRHGGRVWAESKVGEGATFYFTLGEPSAPSDHRETEREPAPVV